MTKTVVDEISARLDTCKECEVVVEKKCCSKTEWYVFNQAFAIVRHAHRLDHTPEWDAYADRESYPNDPPLSEEGFDQARQAGEAMAMREVPWKLIVSSPYLRCAQTASCIAEKLKLPILFDLDLGEVFDQVSMIGDCSGKEQHRAPVVLDAKLKPDFPNVDYIRDASGLIKIDGQLQKFPELFDAARVRFCFRIKKWLQKSAADLSSILIVGHGNAISAVLGLLRETWSVDHIPFASYVIGERQVKIFKKGTTDILREEPVYEFPHEWTLRLHPRLHYVDSAGPDAKAGQTIVEKDMMALEAKAAPAKSTQSEQERKQMVRQSLAGMGASTKELDKLADSIINQPEANRLDASEG
jgi:broad specificity phosphatase PhoE